MRILEICQRNKLMILEAILLVGTLTVLWRIDNVLVSFVCGISSGWLFYRLGERIAKHGIRNA
ncbi:hypothetical protein [Chitinophaga vietnamensis]|uniref:hypothetical protein n=1 Tax=Chitinophaga vietnamensis TaxID=2593957 RepID=UPI0011780996|nr:hypothetical protein [Chitinophaga vietnamensis]